MPDDDRLYIGALNIKLLRALDHDEDAYVDLFESAFDEPVVAALPEASVRLVRSKRPEEEAPEDEEGDAETTPEYWGRLMFASPGKRESIPAGSGVELGVGFHGEELEFVFFPREHRLLFEYRVPAEIVGAALTVILNESPSLESGSAVEVITEQSRDGLEELLSHPLRKLEISLSRPNGDDLGKFERLVEEQIVREKMEKTRTERLDQTHETSHSEGLAPDESIKQSANAALSNGRVVGTWVDGQGNVVRRSTEESPFTATISIDSVRTRPSARSVFYTRARELLYLLLGRKQAHAELGASR